MIKCILLTFKLELKKIKSLVINARNYNKSVEVIVNCQNKFNLKSQNVVFLGFFSHSLHLIFTLIPPTTNEFSRFIFSTSFILRRIWIFPLFSELSQKI